MKAAMYYGPGDIRMEDVAEPDPGPGEVKVRPLWNGLCGTDVHQFFDAPMTPFPLPIVIGHEFSAEVVEVGAGVERVSVGDLVAVDPLWSCGACKHCTTGEYHLCFDVYCHGLGAPGGGIAEATVVKDPMARIVPEGVTPKQAAMVEPLSVAYHGVRQGRPVPGRTAVVLGGGPIGIGSYLALRAQGVEDVIVSEPTEERRAALRSVGAEHVLDPTTTDVAAAVAEHTKGEGADVTIDAAGVAASYATGLAVTGRRGRFVTLAAYMEPVSYNPTELMMREIEIVSSFSTSGEFDTVLGHMAAGEYPTDSWVETVTLDGHLDAYERLHAAQAIKVLVDVAGST
jgi:(R,R)-butanediol dehydrogenase / meso-butanediol dehydrogenase / diacetyl reductase